MKLGIGAVSVGPKVQINMDMILRAEALGFDSTWTAEAYGNDAVSTATWVLAKITKLKVGTAIMQMPARTPAMAAMTAMTLDHLSGGRFILGLGPSGPQVVEGWHGVPYGKPLTRTREYIQINRRILAREAPLEFHGEVDEIPSRGAGLHPTTQMCLAALEKVARPEMRALDLGTGSGILAIGAALLGVKTIAGIDNDPLAVKVAAENAVLNHVAEQITVELGTLEEAKAAAGEGRPAGFDLLIVNILARVIIGLCEAGLGGVVRSGGLAIFAGLIDAQEYGVREALQAQGLTVIDQLQEKDWVCLIARKE